jgi:RNA polymerase sigma-70 factor (ECF subfamily)
MSVSRVLEGRAATQAEPHSAALSHLRFEDVYNQHASFVFRVLRGMGVPDAQVDDAAQDVFLVVHKRLHEFDGRARVTTWLFQIAVRVAYAHRRKARRARDHTPVSEALEDLDGSPHAQAETTEDMARLQRVLDELDDEKRITLVLAEIEELTAPEIAAVTGTPLNTVYTRLRRARASFAALWRARTQGDGHG